MSVLNPIFLNIDSFYGADELGLPYRDIMGEGVVGAGDLAVTEKASGANMSVDVAAGAAWVAGDDDADAQPTYRLRNDATVNVTIEAADATNPRIDLVVARVYDSQFAGVSDTGTIEVVKGTAAGSPSAPSLPNNAIELAQVAVAAAATSIVTADITDSRTRASVGGGLAQAEGGAPGYGTALPASPSDGDEFVLVDDVDTPSFQWRFRYNAGSSSPYKWEFVGGAPLYDELATSATISSGSTYADYNSGKPAVTVPVEGDYIAEFGATIGTTSATAESTNVAVKVGASATDDANSVQFTDNVATTAALFESPARAVRLLAVAASTVLKHQAKSVSGVSSQKNRWLKVTPIRVG